MVFTGKAKVKTNILKGIRKEQLSILSSIRKRKRCCNYIIFAFIEVRAVMAPDWGAGINATVTCLSSS